MSSFGIYKVERLQGSDESLRTTVYNRAMYRRAEIPDDVVKGMSITELTVQQLFSKDTACVTVWSMKTKPTKLAAHHPVVCVTARDV